MNLIPRHLMFLSLCVTSACQGPPLGYFPPACEETAKSGIAGKPECYSDEPGASAKFPHPFVIEVKDVKPAGIKDPYNPSIVDDGKGGFLLSFRFDESSADVFSVFNSRVGLLRLDQNLEIVPGSVSVLNAMSASRQDARLFRYGGQAQLLYGDLPAFQLFRTMFLGSLQEDLNGWNLFDDGPFQLQPQRVEKNWSPFFFVDAFGQEQLLLSYSAEPHHVLKVVDLKSHQIADFSTCNRKLPWKWGSVRGGTPAKLVNGEYVTFFHSVFFDNIYGYRWYVFGAFTFDAQPPFCPKRISRDPIYFKGLYSSASRNARAGVGRIAFPSGLELGTYKGQDVLFVAFGESDSVSKIAVIDREKILNSLIEIK